MSENLKTVPIDEATGKQLRAFAETSLGMTFGQFEKVEAIRAKVKAAWEKHDIPVLHDQADRPSDPRPAPTHPASTGKVRVIIQRTEGPGGDDPVELGVNGRINRYQRGIEVDMDQPYFDVLCKAVQKVYDPAPEGGVKPAREVPLYAFQRVA